MQEPILIRTWAELATCASDTHILEIDVRGCNGWIRNKKSNSGDDNFHENSHYLSTHTFYGLNHKESTKLLQRCGFNIELANWDE